MIRIKDIGTLKSRLFVVGDIHGCPDEVTTLLNYLIRELKLGINDTVVFLGDYVDRGPDSSGVLEVLIKFRDNFPNAYFLLGNHESMLMAFLGLNSEKYGDVYLPNGGVDCLLSYGVPFEMLNGKKVLSKSDMSYVRDAIPESHLKFIENLDDLVISDDVVLVHAGLNPTVSIEKQRQKDTIWIRDPFIFNNHEFKKTVIFGHTPLKAIYSDLPYKVGIDTGLVYGNKLTCLEWSNKVTYSVYRFTTDVVVEDLVK